MRLPGPKVPGKPREEIGILSQSLKRALVAGYRFACDDIWSEAKEVPHR
jgi:hypothetical protein